MRASDKILSAALTELGFPDLAARAAEGEWNDYFGTHALNIHHLIATLQTRMADFPSKAPEIQKVIERAKTGVYDATKAEADEWAKSDEGQMAFGELLRPRGRT